MSLVLCLFFTTGCNAMKKLPAEQFFSGSQLMLAHAIERSDSVEVKDLAGKTDLNKLGAQDMTILFFALQSAYGKNSQQLAIMAELVRSGANPLQQVPNMGSVAEVVATSPYPEYMQAIIDGGMDVNVKIQGQPLLHDAASDDTIKTLTLMVERGANVNAVDSLGKATIMAALDGMQLDTVEWLLNHGANPNIIETNTGWSFMRQLDDVITRNNGDTGATHKKLMDILQLAKQKGGHPYH
ncbi:hypothetical protein DEH81_17825 [Pectobacterium zantedeschiae]|uniref:Ankyrin repeat domain-containing protein n=2 Tax=Pectobacterium zantedeschiae TaxID=2034769 RepID=A0A9X8JNZ9_9GAMM|nr:hypothetical protein DEH81_17825 [Pectobacterium zantedeschiae]RYC46187.1 ankyrin repeat domain-containing protein [Pectobacterium zantedeschiae]RYC50018.1 hypothetical protein CTN06_00425 [Pectobacterium zantedeschiae]